MMPCRGDYAVEIMAEEGDCVCVAIWDPDQSRSTREVVFTLLKLSRLELFTVKKRGSLANPQEHDLVPQGMREMTNLKERDSA